jgi:hypothetical protein
VINVRRISTPWKNWTPAAFPADDKATQRKFLACLGASFQANLPRRRLKAGHQSAIHAQARPVSMRGTPKMVHFHTKQGVRII